MADLYVCPEHGETNPCGGCRAETTKPQSTTEPQPCPTIAYPVHVEPEPGYEGIACILDSNNVLIAAMMHPEHAQEVTTVLNARALAAPVVDAEKRARDLVDAFRFASPPVQSLRFLEWEPLVMSIADALRAAAATAAPQERIPSVRVATAGDNEAAINNLYYACDHCWHSIDYGQVYAQGDSTCPKCNQGIMREIAPLNIPPPAIGAKLLCLVCAHYKPWGIFSSRTGESVCADCRDRRG